MIYWNVFRDKTNNNYCYVKETDSVPFNFVFIKKCLSESEANTLCHKLNEQVKIANGNTRALAEIANDLVVNLQDFYKRANVGWRDEFENWLKRIPKSDRKDLLFPFNRWVSFYTEFANCDHRILWTPFGCNLTEFNFIVCEFVHDGFYNYFEYGQQFDTRDWNFIRAYRNREDARDFVEDHNKNLRNRHKEQAEKNLTEKLAEKLVPKSPNFDSIQSAPLSKVENPKALDWKEAMEALIAGNRVEARVCIPGLPESENGWFEVEFAIGPDDKEFGESIKFGKDWEYRIKDDSKEREELFDECEELGIINISKASKIPTPLLHDIVDAIKSIDLDWEEIAKQINEETK